MTARSIHCKADAPTAVRGNPGPYGQGTTNANPADPRDFRRHRRPDGPQAGAVAVPAGDARGGCRRIEDRRRRRARRSATTPSATGSPRPCSEFAKDDWDEAKWREFARRLFYVSGDAAKPGGLDGVKAWLEKAEGGQRRPAAVLPGRRAEPLRRHRPPARRRRPEPPAGREAGRASSSKSRSAATWPRPATSTASCSSIFARGADLPHRPLSRQGDGAKHPRVPLRQHAVRAGLELQLHRPRADHRQRERSSWRAAATTTTSPACSATCSRTTCCSC